MQVNFEISGGSITGKSHMNRGKNNQDAFQWLVSDQLLAAVICDGCSEGKYSEIGANLISKYIIRRVQQSISRRDMRETLHKDPTCFFETLKRHILLFIKTQAGLIGNDFKQTIKDFFLFTITGAILTKQNCYLFSIGDGVFQLNNELMVMGPYLNNQPPYVAYNLLDLAVKKERQENLEFKLQKILPTACVDTLILGSDGVLDLIENEQSQMPGADKFCGGLNQFVSRDCFLNNPDQIRRHLFMMNRDIVRLEKDRAGNITGIKKKQGLLPDDTTLIALRKKA